MKAFLCVVLVVASGGLLFPQEREIPSDSALVSIRGCAKGRSFVVGPRSEDQPGTIEIQPGRRFRLSGPKAILNEIKKRERMMVALTGLVRRSQLAGPGGIAIAGGRVRIGGATPRDMRNDSGYTEVVIDVESWRPLPEPCPGS
jgi:hypothetical protein